MAFQPITSHAGRSATSSTQRANSRELKERAEALYADLHAGTWRLDRRMFETDGKPQGSPQRIRPDIGSRLEFVGWGPSGGLHYLTATSQDRLANVGIASLDLANGRFQTLRADERNQRDNTRSPSFSPDGKRIAYLSESRGRQLEAGAALVIRDLESGGVMREIRPPQIRRVSEILAWSPDGRSVFASANEVNGEQMPLGDGIYRIDLQTGNAATVLRFDRDRQPMTTGFHWMPDGQSFLTSATGTNNVGSIWYRVDARTGNRTALGIEESKAASQAGQMTPSRDGKSVYYRLNVRTNSGRGSQAVALVKRDLETARSVELLRQTPMGVFFLSPDDRYVALAAIDDSSSSRVIRLVPTAGGDARTIMRFPNSGEGPYIAGWLPDGSALLVQHRPTTNDPARLGALELWLAYADGREPQKLEGTIPEGRFVAVSPDGRHLAYTSTGPGRPAVLEVVVLENLLPRK